MLKLDNTWFCFGPIQRVLVISAVLKKLEHNTVSVTCDVSLRMDPANSRFKSRLQCTLCFCAIVYIALLWEGWITGQYKEHYVCVWNFLCMVVCVVCVLVCLYVWERLYLTWSLDVVLAQDHIFKVSSLWLWDHFSLIYLIIRVDWHEIHQVSD